MSTLSVRKLWAKKLLITLKTVADVQCLCLQRPRGIIIKPSAGSHNALSWQERRLYWRTSSNLGQIRCFCSLRMLRQVSYHSVYLFMSPLRRHIFVCFMDKRGVFGPSSVKRGRTHIVLGWNMSGASTSTYRYPENLGSGGQLPAEVRGRVCRFFVCLFFCLSVTLRC